MGVENVIVGASYNAECPHDQLVSKVVKEYAAEINKGREYPNHYLYRNGTNDVKFVWPLHQVPIIAYQYVSLLRSKSAKNVAVVGNSLVGVIIESLNREFSDELKEYDKNIVFAHEGDEWSLLNTLHRGHGALKCKKDDTFAFLSGDTPLFWHVDGLLNDPDAHRHDGVLDLNSLERIFKEQAWPGHFPRYYHWRIKDGEPYHIKEPNAFILRLTDRVHDIIEETYATRKTGRSGGIKDMIFTRCLLKNPHKTLPYLLRHELKNVGRLTAEAFDYMMRPMRFEYYPLDMKVMDLSATTASRLLSIGTGADIKVKVQHDDPGRIEDIDSLEDYGIVAEMLRRDPSIYPYQDDIKRIRRMITPRLEGRYGFLASFPRRVNEFAKNVGAGQLFEPVEGIAPHTDSFCENYPKLTEEMIDAGIECHKNFNISLERWPQD